MVMYRIILSIESGRHTRWGR